MRFLFVDRIVDLDAGRSIQTVKNVSASEDFFTDHFPGAPIMPGALILECFIQSSMLMLGVADGFGSRPVVARVRRAAFRHLVRPGDQLAVRCESRDQRVVHASARVDGRQVATAVMEFERGPALPPENALRAFHDALQLPLSALAPEVGTA